MEYADYLKTPEWQERRRRRIVLDKFRCAICGQTKGLQVHHINYDRVMDEDIYADLITLCHVCHERIESVKELEQRRFTNDEWLLNCFLHDVEPWDILFGGDFNLCSMKDILRAWVKWLSWRGLPELLVTRYCPRQRTMEYFRDKRIRKILAMKADGKTVSEIVRMGISRKMVVRYFYDEAAALQLLQTGIGVGYCSGNASLPRTQTGVFAGCKCV